MPNPRPHYCMVAHTYSHDVRVIREADELVSNGYTVDLFCLRRPSEPATETIDDINAYRLPVRRHKGSSVIVQFLEYLTFFWLVFIRLARSTARYDVVHVHNLPDFLVFSTLVPRLRGARVVLDIHDLMPEFYLSRFGHRIAIGWLWLVGLQEKLACRFADHVITVSEPWRQTLIKRGVSARKCSVVMNVPGTRFTQNASRVKTRLPEADDFHLFYHGNLVYRYGIDLALQAVAQVHHELPGLHFTILGWGEYLNNLLHLAETLELNNIVAFREGVPIEELPRLIASAHVGIVPCRCDIFTDGILPVKLMEYVAMGIPVITARTSTIEAYFDDTMVEFFTPGSVDDLADCIRRLYHDHARLAQLARNADRFNQRYNWPEQAVLLIDLANRLARR